MSEIILRKMGEEEYQLELLGEVEESWSDVDKSEAIENAKEYIGDEVMSFGPPKARAIFKNLNLKIAYRDDTS